MTGERILVTGAGGFLGSHIARHFAAQGYPVAALGRFAASAGSAAGFPSLWKLYGMTLPDPALLAAVADFRPTLLVHCAGTASVADSVREPYQDFRRTVEVCAFTLEALRTHAPDCRFVLLSSASVYGNPVALPIPETALARPVSPYGYHKMLCETLVEEYASLHGMKTAVLRIFSAYGERLRKQVVHDICQKFIDRDSSSVELFGTGKESRDFIHAVDIARAIERIHEVEASGIFNLASGVQTTIEELACTLGGLFNSSKKVAFNGAVRPGDPLNWEASVARMSSLGCFPSMELEQGLAKYVTWFRSHYDNGDATKPC